MFKKETKICSRCKKDKKLTQYTLRKDQLDGYDFYCKRCKKSMSKKYNIKNRKKIKKRRKIYRKLHLDIFKCKDKKYYKKHKIKVLRNRRRWTLKNKFGITLEQYNELLKKQNYRCAICRKIEKVKRRKLAIDHDHSCCSKRNACVKCIRGLLCMLCNVKLGILEDKLFRKLANKYLGEHNAKL